MLLSTFSGPLTGQSGQEPRAPTRCGPPETQPHEATSAAERILKSLAFVGMNKRGEAIQGAHHNTLQWVFGDKEVDDNERPLQWPSFPKDVGNGFMQCFTNELGYLSALVNKVSVSTHVACATYLRLRLYLRDYVI